MSPEEGSEAANDNDGCRFGCRRIDRGVRTADLDKKGLWKACPRTTIESKMVVNTVVFVMVEENLSRFDDVSR